MSKRHCSMRKFSIWHIMDEKACRMCVTTFTLSFSKEGTCNAYGVLSIGILTSILYLFCATSCSITSFCSCKPITSITAIRVAPLPLATWGPPLIKSTNDWRKPFFNFIHRPKKCCALRIEYAFFLYWLDAYYDASLLLDSSLRQQHAPSYFFQAAKSWLCSLNEMF